MGPNNNDTGKKTYLAGGTIAVNDRVTISGSSGGFNTVIAAGVGDPGIGIAMDAASSGSPVTVRMWGHPGTHTGKASAAITLGAAIYPAAAGKFSPTAGTGGTIPMGVAEQSASGDGAYFEFNRNATGVGAAAADSQAIVAAGTAHTNSTDEAILASHSIPANRLRDGTRIRIFAQVIATATNSTDTLTLKIRVGGVAGTVIFATAAIDVADNDIGVIVAEAVIRTDGASGTLVGAGIGSLGVPTTGTARGSSIGSTAIDTTAAQVVCVTGDWSVASASNSCRADIFNVDVIG